MIRAGLMRHRIRFERRSQALDPAGEQGLEWVPAFGTPAQSTKWAALQRTNGKEITTAAQQTARVPVTFRLRYFEGVTSDLRIIYAGRVHRITSVVDQEGRREELIITGTELVGEAA